MRHYRENDEIGNKRHDINAAVYFVDIFVDVAHLKHDENHTNP